MRVTAIIPAYNGSSTLPATIAALQGIAEIDRILVVDDGSTDDTAAAAWAAGAQVVSHPVNRGKGAALNTGLDMLRNAEFDALALVDCDLGPSAALFSALIAPIRDGCAEMTIARFPSPQRRGGFGLAKGFCRLGLRVLTGMSFASPMSGQRVIAAGIAKSLVGFAPGWGCEPALTIDLHRLGGRILEVPVPMTHAETGRNLAGFCHRGRQLLAAAKIFAQRALFRPKRRVKT